MKKIIPSLFMILILCVVCVETRASIALSYRIVEKSRPSAQDNHTKNINTKAASPQLSLVQRPSQKKITRASEQPSPGRRNGKALASLLIGIGSLGLCFVFPPLGILGLVGMILGFRAIRRGQSRLFAWLGILIGMLALMIGLLTLVVFTTIM